VSRDAVTNAEGQVTGVEIPPHEMHSGYWFTYPELIHVEFGRRFEDMPGFLSDEDDSASGDESDLGVLHEKLDDFRREVDKQRTYAEVYKGEYEKCKELNAVLNARLVGAPKLAQHNAPPEEVKEEEEYEQSEAYEEYEQSKYDFLYNNNVRPCFSQFIQDYPMGYSFQKPDGDVRYMKVYIYEEEDDEFYEESPPDAKVDPPPPPPTTEVTSVQLRMPPAIETRVTRELWREDNVLWVNIVPYNEPCRYELDFSSKDKYVLNIWYMDSGKSPLHGKQLVKYEAVRNIGGRLLSHYVKLVGVDYVIDTEHESPFTCPDFKVAPSEEVKGEENDEESPPDTAVDPPPPPPTTEEDAEEEEEEKQVPRFLKFTFKQEVFVRVPPNTDPRKVRIRCDEGVDPPLDESVATAHVVDDHGSSDIKNIPGGDVSTRYGSVEYPEGSEGEEVFAGDGVPNYLKRGPGWKTW
jgi:hypothetical protein